VGDVTHIVMYSGGIASWATARRVAERYGTERLILLFADTLMEDGDLYRFLDESAKDVGGTLVKLAEGRDPWQVFFDVRFLGNTRVDPCSRVLKRELLRRWLEEHHAPEETVVHLGFDWTEGHRFKRAQGHWQPWTATAPMTEPPMTERADLLADLSARGIEPPRLYALGFPHNNCGGFCIKAGQAHFVHLLRTMPERYAYHEGREQELREYLGADVAILRDRRGGTTRPYTLRELRENVQGPDEPEFDGDEWGGCGCFSDDGQP
jgi:hypothetical protein